MSEKPTIHELEDLMDNQSRTVEIRPDGTVRVHSKWRRSESEHPMPPRHAVHRVWRRDVGFFDATPCYGLHAPWWVPRNGYTREESEPIPFDDTYWQSLPEAPEFFTAAKEETVT